jgi:hypothetical protein
MRTTGLSVVCGVLFTTALSLATPLLAQTGGSGGGAGGGTVVVLERPHRAAVRHLPPQHLVRLFRAQGSRPAHPAQHLAPRLAPSCRAIRAPIFPSIRPTAATVRAAHCGRRHHRQHPTAKALHPQRSPLAAPSGGHCLVVPSPSKRIKKRRWMFASRLGTRAPTSRRSGGGSCAASRRTRDGEHVLT